MIYMDSSNSGNPDETEPTTLFATPAPPARLEPPYNKNHQISATNLTRSRPLSNSLGRAGKPTVVATMVFGSISFFKFMCRALQFNYINHELIYYNL